MTARKHGLITKNNNREKNHVSTDRNVYPSIVDYDEYVYDYRQLQRAYNGCLLTDIIVKNVFTFMCYIFYYFDYMCRKVSGKMSERMLSMQLSSDS